MASSQPWLAKLIEKAVVEYLRSSKSPNRSSASFDCTQDLSKLKISPKESSLDVLYLRDIRPHSSQVQALVCDSNNTIPAIFPNLGKTPDGSIFAQNLVGATLKLQSFEIRVSDCFQPPTVELYVKSFTEISWTGKTDCFQKLKGVAEDPRLSRALLEYGLQRAKVMGVDGEDQEPYASQEDYSTQIPYKSLNAATSPRPVSEEKVPYSLSSPVQLLQQKTAIPRSGRNNEATTACPSKSLNDRPAVFRSTSADTTSTKRSATTPSYVTQMPRFISTQESNSCVQLPDNKSINPRNTSKRGPEETYDHSSDTKSKRAEEQASKTLKSASKLARGSVLTRIANAQTVPRYLKVCTKQQRDIVDSVSSWQPPLVGEPSIQGQLPLELLNRLAQAADSPEISHSRSLPMADLDHGNVECENTEINKSSDAIPKSTSISLNDTPDSSSPISWTQSPPRPVPAPRRLPPDSSPMRDYISDPGSEKESIGRGRVNSIPKSSCLTQHGQVTACSTLSAGSEKELNAPQSSRNGGFVTFQRGADFCTDAESLNDETRENCLSHPNEIGCEILQEDQRHISELTISSSSNKQTQPFSTSSFESSRKVQVSRTPALQKCDSDRSKILARGPIYSPNHRNSSHSLTQSNLAPPSPPSSYIVSETCFTKPTPDMMLPRTSMSTPPSSHSRAGLGREAEKATRHDEKKIMEQRSEKRRHSDSIEGSSSKRQKMEETPDKLKTIVTSADPDFREWERERRQERRQGIAELEAVEKAAEIENPAADAACDVQSVPSRSRPPSAHSSLFSRIRDPISTPISHSSDFQLPKSVRNDASVNTLIPHNVFENFARQYPRYRGSQKQFDKACQILKRAGDAAPHSWLWDDFIFRYNNDYVQGYREEEIPNHLPFEVYYRIFERKPQIAEEPVITRDVLSRVSDGNSVEEHTTSPTNDHLPVPKMMMESSLDARMLGQNAAPKEPQLPQELHRSKDSHNEVTYIQPKSHLQSINRSQDLSVKIWLARVPGAASPELGQSPLGRDGSEVSSYDLNERRPRAVLVTQSKRILPWEDDKRRLAIEAIPTVESSSARKNKDEKRKKKIIRRHTDFPMANKTASVNLTEAVEFQKPLPNAMLFSSGLQGGFVQAQKDMLKPAATSGRDIYSWRQKHKY